jgi:molecular chaperone GrpE
MRAAEPAAASSELQSLKAQLELSQQKGRETLERLKEEHDRFLRAAADLENYRKRAHKEREEIQKFGVEKLLKDLLPILDNLERALRAAPDGDPLAGVVRMVLRAFEETLGRYGVKAFSALGQPFDPRLHEAVLEVESAEGPGTVVFEQGRGYLLHERLVRPAIVGVAVAPRPPPESPPPAADGQSQPEETVGDGRDIDSE